MELASLAGIALFVAPPCGYPFGRDSNRRTAEAMACGGAPRSHRPEADLPKAARQEPSPSAELAALLRHCAGGDRAAFRRLYDVQAGRLYAIALRITRQSALAADAVHDAFLQVWQHAARFDPSRGNAEAWMLSLVRYRALDIARRHAREMPGLELPETADENPDPLAQLIGTTEGEALHRCLQTLAPERRRLVVMAFVDGLTHSELATRLGQPLGTVKSSIRRALISLKQCLGA